MVILLSRSSHSNYESTNHPTDINISKGAIVKRSLDLHRKIHPEMALEHFPTTRTFQSGFPTDRSEISSPETQLALKKVEEEEQAGDSDSNEDTSAQVRLIPLLSRSGIMVINISVFKANIKNIGNRPCSKPSTSGLDCSNSRSSTSCYPSTNCSGRVHH
jgi:hypothetical protein